MVTIHKGQNYDPDGVICEQ
uniref:Uncharacterized protein n=1 Tax=Anguilla anguilla TaxID=7936 RepID=A0A0E9XU40_ANGAN